ncbi:septum formation initiator family protein [Gracilibacillus oryzae]|uniref:Septum formation initiator family protein n=1 Tax=Gracilibacillus oryzae TaxID=1672701 RepID=A0A7C8KSE6_9BACI|nr:septum formation initiator family protein [Gracilibacillus oryzae]KAB8126505.1 septum formation initiator family protein [Gracilibacillus oryzae]
MAKHSSNVSSIHEAYIEQHKAHHRRQTERKKRLFRRVSLFFLIVMIIAISLTTYHVKQRVAMNQLQTEYQEKSEHLAKLEQEHQNLEEEVKLLNDEEYLLQIAKTNYFFTKEGEIVFKLPEEETSY